MAVANTPAYYDTSTITVVKIVLILVPGKRKAMLNFSKKEKKTEARKKTFFKTFDLIFFNEFSYTFKGVYFLLNIDNCDFFIFCHHYHIIIVSRFPNETKHFSLQTFIVKILIIQNIHIRHIYMKQKEGASVQVSGETERERE